MSCLDKKHGLIAPGAMYSTHVSNGTVGTTTYNKKPLAVQFRSIDNEMYDVEEQQCKSNMCPTHQRE